MEILRHCLPKKLAHKFDFVLNVMLDKLIFFLFARLFGRPISVVTVQVCLPFLFDDIEAQTRSVSCCVDTGTALIYQWYE